MKMTAKMFGVLCAASLMFCAACDGIGNKDEDEDNDNKGDTTTTVSYDVGSIVPFMERQYLVTKNCEGAVTTELTSVKTTDLGTYYPNERADAYRKKLLAGYGVTAYVELFDITEDKDVSPGSGDSVLNDTYMILHDRQGVYRVKQRRIASDLFSGDDAESRSKPFNEKTNDELRRNYDPNLISITNFPFVMDLSKRFQEEYSFIYAGDKDSDKQTLAYSDNELDYVFKRLNYAKINGSERNVYGFRDRKAVGKRSEPQHCWELNHLNANKRFFEFDVISDGSSYRLVAQGEGTIEGNASDAVYKGTLTINSVQYDSSGTLDLQYNVDIKKNGSTVSKKVLPEGFDDNFVIKSSRMVSVEGVNFDVPETITFFVPFFDDNFVVNHNAVLNNYTKVTFVPKAKSGSVIYVPKPDTTYPYEFIARFMKDYQTVFGKDGGQGGQDDGSGSETSEPSEGKADWTGFTMVNSADDLDFKVGTYEVKCISFEEYQGKTKSDTMIYDVEIIADAVILREKTRIRVYSNQEDYDIKKASVKDIDGYSWEDSTRTIIRTYTEVSDESMSFSEFKEEFFSFPEDIVEDNYSRTYTDKKLGSKNGVIQASCTETIIKTEIKKYYYTITLSPQQ